MGGLRTWPLVLASLTAVAGCFSPTPAPGLPCSSEDLACPVGQRCDLAAPGGPTCVLDGDLADAPPAGADAEDVDAPPGTPDAPAAPDARPDAGVGLVVNDDPDGAIDVSAGGTFTWNPMTTADDYPASCTGPGGRDVFFTLVLPATEVVYLDTFGSDYDAVISIHAGPCTLDGATEACVDDSCSSGNAQGAWNLGAGTHCVVVDAGSAGAGANGTIGSLTVVRGGHAGQELTGGGGVVTGNTCLGDDSNNAFCDCGPAKDDHWFFIACPNVMFSADVDTCTDPQYDSVLQIRDAAGLSLACEDNDQCGPTSENVSEPISMKGLYWVIVDGCSDCGPYTLTYNF